MAITKPTISDVWGNTNTTSPDMVAPSYIPTGFPAPAGVPVKPPRGYINWLFNWLMNAVRYISIHGIVEWDAAETHYNDGFPAPFVRDNDGYFYQLTGTATTGVHPRLDLGNWELVLKTPRAKSTFLALPIWVWRNALGFQTFGIDHMGFPAGQLLELMEDWHDIGFTPKIGAGSGNWARHWAWGGFGATFGSVAANALTDLAKYPWGPNATISCSGATGNVAGVIESYAQWIRLHSSGIAWENHASITGSADLKTSSSVAFGIGDGTLISGADPSCFGTGTVLPVGFGFRAVGGSPNWGAWVKPPGGSFAETDTGIAVARNTPHRFRIQYAGSNEADSATAHVTFLIDGVQVADFAGGTYDYTAAGGTFAWPFFRMSGVNTETCQANFGPLRMLSRLVIGNVLI